MSMQTHTQKEVLWWLGHFLSKLGIIGDEGLCWLGLRIPGFPRQHCRGWSQRKLWEYPLRCGKGTAGCPVSSCQHRMRSRWQFCSGMKTGLSGQNGSRYPSRLLSWALGSPSTFVFSCQGLYATLWLLLNSSLSSSCSDTKVSHHYENSLYQTLKLRWLTFGGKQFSHS